MTHEPVIWTPLVFCGYLVSTAKWRSPQNQKMAKLWRYLWRMYSPTGLLIRVTSSKLWTDHTQNTLEYCQGWRLNNPFAWRWGLAACLSLYPLSFPYWGEEWHFFSTSPQAPLTVTKMILRLSRVPSKWHQPEGCMPSGSVEWCSLPENSVSWCGMRKKIFPTADFPKVCMTWCS